MYTNACENMYYKFLNYEYIRDKSELWNGLRLNVTLQHLATATSMAGNKTALPNYILSILRSVNFVALPFCLSSSVKPHPATVADVPLKSWAGEFGRQAGCSPWDHLSCLAVFRSATSLDFLLHLVKVMTHLGWLIIKDYCKYVYWETPLQDLFYDGSIATMHFFLNHHFLPNTLCDCGSNVWDDVELTSEHLTLPTEICILHCPRE